MARIILGATENATEEVHLTAARPSPDGLLTKLLKAQQAVESVGKDGRNEHHKYDYVRAEDVVRAATKAIGEAGLVAWAEGPEGRGSSYALEVQEGRTQNGGRAVTVTARGHLVIADPETGDELAFPIVGTGTDSPGDKAIYKALTGGLKYAWGTALQIAFGDDPEDDSMPGAKGAANQQAAGNGGPAFGPPTDDVERAKAAVLYLLTGGDLDGVDQGRADRILEAIAEDAGGYFPNIAGRALLRVAADLKAEADQEAGVDPADGDDDQGGDDDAPAPDETAPAGEQQPIGDDPDVKF